MHAGGRPRKPTHLKLVAGTQRPSRVNPAEPKLAIRLPRIPAHLSAVARLAWLRFAPILAKMGVITAADGSALERLCACYAEIRALEDTIAAEGATVRLPIVRKESGDVARGEGGEVLYGKTMVHPAVGALADADRRFKGWLSEFGLTPAARSKVSTVTLPSKEPGADLLD